MRRLLPLIVTLCLGCAAGPRPSDAVPVSAVRTSLLRKVEGLLRKSLEDDGWVVGRFETKSEGTVARNSGDAWDENVVTATFDASKPPADAVALSVPEQVAVMANLRLDLRKVVTNQDGEVIDVTQGEAYRERTLTMTYRLDAAVGTVTVRLRPATDVPEETRNRFDVTVREQPAK